MKEDQAFSKRAVQYAEWISDLQSKLYEAHGIDSRPMGKDYIVFVSEMALIIYEHLPEREDLEEIFYLLEQWNTHTGATALELALRA